MLHTIGFVTLISSGSASFSSIGDCFYAFMINCEWVCQCFERNLQKFEDICKRVHDKVYSCLGVCKSLAKRIKGLKKL